jgi:hypothetical protein
MVKIKQFLSYQLLKPLNLKLIFDDLLKIRSQCKSDDFHLGLAFNWLINAQKATPDGGVSYGYNLITGWASSYPETSGYIIPTFLNYYKMSGKQIIKNISYEITNWLCSIQFNNGGFPGRTISFKSEPVIFNTGQIIFGLCEAYNIFDKNLFINSAIRAGNFLVKNQDDSGNWTKFCYRNKPHTYNVRTAWALLELYNITKDNRYLRAAKKNFDWAKTQINQNYWFFNNDPREIKKPLLHFISYTIRGFLEGGLILKDNSLIEIAYQSSLKLLTYYKENGKLPARYNSKWKSKETYSCLTGIAQLCIIWLKLYHLYKKDQFRNNANELIQYLKKTQINLNKYPGVNGGIKGSDPIWGSYRSFYILNWATKFFCDALIIKNQGF